MPKYRVEASAEYKGFREYMVPPTTTLVGAIATESLPLGTIFPYRTRGIRTGPPDYRGFYADCSIVLAQYRVTLKPQIDEGLLQEVIAKEIARNPAYDRIKPEDYEELMISHEHMRKQGGTKLYLRYNNDEWPITLFPPAEE